MAATFAQQNMNSFTAASSESSFARKAAAFSFILFVMGIAAAVSIIIFSAVSVRIISAVSFAVIILLVLVILIKIQPDLRG